MKYVFLTDAFYQDYAHCREIEQKRERPYVQLLIATQTHTFAIPFRSGIKHGHAFFTDRANHCGVDYTKAVVVTDVRRYIHAGKRPIIRAGEHRALIGKDYEISKGLTGYIAQYAKAVVDNLTPL